MATVEKKDYQLLTIKDFVFFLFHVNSLKYKMYFKIKLQNFDTTLLGSLN